MFPQTNGNQIKVAVDKVSGLPLETLVDENLVFLVVLEVLVEMSDNLSFN